MKPSLTKLILVVLLFVCFSFAEAQVLNISPDLIDFGSVNVGTSETRFATISTVEAAGVVINEVSILGDFSYFLIGLPAFPTTVYPAAPLQIEVMFSPMGPGMASAMLEVSPATFPPQSINISGIGAPTGGMDPAMLTYPADYDFGTLDVGASNTANLEVRLTAEWAAMYGTGQINDVTMTGSTDYSFGTMVNSATSEVIDFPYSLGSGDAIILHVNYSPTDAGDDFATIELQTTDSRLYQIFVNGIGNQPSPNIVLDPNSLVIQTQEESTTSSYFDIFNTGTTDLTFFNDTSAIPDWISLDVSEGTVAPGASSRIGVIVNTEGIIADNYSYLLHITNNDPDTADQTLMITVVVDALPIVVDFSASMVNGHPPF